MISVFDMFKIGIGPSSSHTVGPMKAGKQFIDDLITQHLLEKTQKIQVDVYGSLSMTGLGHGTDIAIIMGLAGYLPHNVEIERIPAFIAEVKKTAKLPLAEGKQLAQFNPATDMIFHQTFLPLHENGMTITAFHRDQELYKQTYYSIGGGFIVDDAHFNQTEKNEMNVPYPYHIAADILRSCQESGLSISSLMMQNELALHSEDELKTHLHQVWQTMKDCIEHGLHTEGVLPGPLKVARRAATLYRMLKANSELSTDPMSVIDWVNMFALAVNEENAAGGRVVTAPTNGACGIVPAVLAYYEKFVGALTDEIVERYLLACSMIGSLYKMNASISGAEVGCQGEVGVACSMAAAGLSEILGGSPEQVCIAAEIAMEHNLGLTCDPVGGQVQVPCIERNAIASVKAINASRMALRRTTSPRVSLDKVIETMYETGKDMNAKYRETSQGGLAIKVVCS
ncbi:L-serine ammonia-lyase [Aggregatibacter actinomycetemcomitans serotype e str. SC1083]|uniref:L-serine dehydratase n=1 Tax=Aggregatibacter actinomycetemcomitans serotype e str. SC1083 TaxID=907488 RepID=G4AA62_AGGAC|nr:L-serine ammonia-lyase [Aggregatibacter actinomycetemcomitans]EGY33174.1 L-serine ammonia-lyase [Aggregatibacter actinomycetemcomitans serotype e str. SC1083]KYK76424.1 serine dehydratase [Aggregatibacter actinomycetemcomitans serotype e str. SA3096]KYK82585.1 serine dehydratase [Aggregatibacter actinomycetemcomitans serotype e str. SC936]KYK96085.1 serine dehydratase [Aggregatibacter actinomycetemcomitans serotype e str. ANH9776]TYB20776.1 L-serine ammonia-lyase [Aggregatibacter actinomyce